MFKIACRLTLALALGTSSAAVAQAEFFSDSGIDGPPYADILRQTAALAPRYPGWATVHDYGQTLQRRTLRLVKIQDPAYVTPTDGARAAVLISGSIHGNEYLHIEDRLADWFLANRAANQGVSSYLASGGIIYIVPILNPDGYEADERGNSRNVDLNRDFDLLPTGDKFFRQVETRLLAEWIDRDLLASGARLKLTLDYHCCVGALAMPWAYSDEPLPADAHQRHADVAQLMQRHISGNYLFGNSMQTVGYNSRGTSKDYFYAKYGSTSFTFEGVYREEAAKFPQHAQWWNAILAQLAGADASAE